MAVHRQVWFCALTLAACGGERDLTLAFPDLAADTQTIVLLYEGEAEPVVEVFAQGADPIVARRSGELTRVTLISYADPVESLELPVGLLERSFEGECRAVPLPDAYTGVWRHELEDEADPFESLGELPDVAADFLFKLPCPCFDFEVVHRVPFDEVRASDAVALADGFLVASTERLYRIDLEGGIAQVPFAAEPHSLYRAPDDQIFVGTADGRLFSGTLAGGFTETSTGQDSPVQMLDGSVRNGVIELFTLQADDVIRRRVGDGPWEIVFDQADDSTNQISDLEVMAPGQMVALQGGGPGPIFFDETASPQVIVDPWELLAGPPSNVDFVPGVGLFLGTRTFNLHRFDSIGAWPILPEVKGVGSMRDMVLLEGGAAFAGHDGRIGYFHPQVGVCLDDNIELAQPNFHHLAAIGRRILLAGEPNGTQSLLMVEATPAPVIRWQPAQDR